MQNRTFRTGEQVSESGSYVCASGQKNVYNKGEAFGACPVSGKETSWTRVDNSCGCGCG